MLTQPQGQAVSQPVTNLSPQDLLKQKRASELNSLVDSFEKLCVDNNITVGEWSIIVKTIDNRQNSLIINNRIQEYAKSNEGSDEASPIKEGD